MDFDFTPIQTKVYETVGERVHTLHENLDKTASTLGKYHLGEPFDTTARL